MATIAYARQRNQGLGSGQAIMYQNPKNEVARRAPTSSDKKEVGTFWFYPLDINNNAVGNAYVQTYTTGSNWLQLAIQGGAGSFSSLAVTGAITAGTGLTATTGGVTATAGNITATNGNLVLSTAGNKISIATGANASLGTSAAMVAGTVTVATTAVTASSRIFLTTNTPGGTQGVLSAPTASIVAGTSFVINSSNAADTSTVNWWIVN